MLVDAALAVQLVLADAVKHALRLPGHARDAVHGPSHADEPVLRLPDAAHLHVQLGEEDAPVEAQAPEDELVVLEPGKVVARVPKGYVVAVDVDCAGSRRRPAALSAGWCRVGGEGNRAGVWTSTAAAVAGCTPRTADSKAKLCCLTCYSI